MTDRIALDDMTSDELDALYAELERMKFLVAASSEEGHAVRMAAQYADRAIENGERAEQVEAVLREVLSQFTEHGHPGRPCLRTPWLNVETVGRWRAALDQPQ
ncbi:hypothetical protein [Streptomyces sp. NPDC057580]|uniref:hypothetical protein n=1 Tax=Streptomyces sp. NPDC057580 TaxID=3346173 RepID=UPI0036C7AB97